jgi:3-oxoacyl-[acyl-carrier-protein] synthase III
MSAIHSIACALPATAVSNADLDRANPGWAMDLVAKRSGIDSRYYVAPGETAFDLSVRACDALFEQSDAGIENVDAILYCTHYPDYPMPGNAHLLHRHLGLGDDVLVFDYRLACSGFVYGLAFADAFVRAGMASEVLLVTVETPSQGTNRGDRAVRALFGDGAAVTYLSANDASGGRIVAHELCAHGKGFDYAYVPAGGVRNPPGDETKVETKDASGNVRTPEDVHIKGPELWGFVNSVVPGHVEAFLAKHSLSLDDIDLCVFHQASRLVLESLAKALSIPPDKMYVHMKDAGNLSSASIPFALRAALGEGRIKPGDRVLLSGFGSGISYGSAIVEY